MTNTKTKDKTFEWSDDWGYVVAAIILLGLMSSWMTGSESRSSAPRMTEWTVLGKGHSRNVGASFDGGSAFALLGKHSVDLRSAVITRSDGEVEVVATALLGKVEIMVPEDWEVDVGGIAILGKLENDAGRVRSGNDANKARLRVRGVTVMGKVEVER